MAVPEQLLADVKNYLNITWEDTATDAKLSGIIAGGMAFLNLKAGEEVDYSEDGLPRSLLFDYCRYVRDDALDVFENNYFSLILAMRHEREVRRYAQAAGTTEQ